MGTTANKILELARKELGVKEAPAGSNNVKYNTAYHLRAVSGSDYAWCAAFVWWLFQRAGASELYFDGSKTAYVPTLLGWANRRGLLVDTPQPGDLVCFDFNGNNKADHIGICERFAGNYVTTIDGNTGTTNEANGGCVMRRRRHKKYILAVIRPQYNEEDEEMDISKLSDEDVLLLADRIDQLRSKQQPSGWSDEAREWAEKNGIVKGDGTGQMAYKKGCTREEMVQILHNMVQK